MGIQCAPTYANIFMGKFEEKHIYQRTKEKLLPYVKHTDEIPLAQTDFLARLKLFRTEINHIHETVKLEMEFSSKEIPFLGKLVYIRIPT